MVQVCNQLATLSSFHSSASREPIQPAERMDQSTWAVTVWIFAVLYRADVLLSRGEVVTFDLIEDSKLKQLKYGDISAI